MVQVAKEKDPCVDLLSFGMVVSCVGEEEGSRGAAASWYTEELCETMGVGN